MRQNLKSNSEKEGVELERHRILTMAYSYRHQLYQLAFKRLRRAEHAQHVVDIAFTQLGDKQNLERLKYFLKPWLQVYVNHLCDRYETNHTDVFSQVNSQASEHSPANGRAHTSDTLRIVHQMKNNLTRSIRRPPSPAA